MSLNETYDSLKEDDSDWDKIEQDEPHVEVKLYRLKQDEFV